MTIAPADRHQLGLVRLGSAIPTIHLASPSQNADALFEMSREAGRRHVDVLIFPELSLTGYTCADLFFQRPLIDASKQALIDLCQRLRRQPADSIPSLIAVGLPWAQETDLYNVAAMIHQGHVIGIVPKQQIPNYKEYYERRWFRSGTDILGQHIDGQQFKQEMPIPFGVDLLFEANEFSSVVVGLEICEDLWVPQPPSGNLALAGATLIGNLSASVVNVGKADYRRSLVENQSARCVAGYAYTASGIDESTTDFVFDGHAMIAANGSMKVESERFLHDPTLIVADIDVQQLEHDRWQMTTFTEIPAVGNSSRSSIFRRIKFSLPSPVSIEIPLEPAPVANPFVPADNRRRAERCEEIFQIQVAGLGRRLKTVRPSQIALGVSGGLDSTWALLVVHQVLKTWPLEDCEFLAITMPGFGTSDRTLENARSLMSLLGVTTKTLDIRMQCFDTFKHLQHQPFGIDLTDLTLEEFQRKLHDLPSDNRHDLVFENVQARMRTLNLMSEGFVIGTGDF